jgi:hypothetical protein
MRTSLASFLIVCLTGTATSVRAQVPTAAGPFQGEPGGPLAQSAAQEAARLAASSAWTTIDEGSQDPVSRPGVLGLKWNELSPVISGRTITLVAPGGASLTGEVMTVREHALVLEINKTSDRAAYPGPSATIPRESITELTLERRRGSWGRASAPPSVC